MRQMEHVNIISHTFRLHKCTCANIKVGRGSKASKEEFRFECAANKQRFEHSKHFPSPTIVLQENLKSKKSIIKTIIIIVCFVSGMRKSAMITE